MGVSITGVDEAFGRVRNAVVNEVKDIIGGIHVNANFGNGQPSGVSVSLGERRVLSVWALVLTLAVGAGLAFMLIPRRKRRAA